MAKKEKIEGRKRRKESLYALLLVLWLVVTKESIKIAHNLASEVYQRKLKEKRQRRNPALAHKCPMEHEKVTHNETFTQKTTKCLCYKSTNVKNQRWCWQSEFPASREKKPLWCDVIANTQQLHRRKVREDRSLVTTHIQRQMEHHSRTFISLI